jgi:hypothetical protein
LTSPAGKSGSLPGDLLNEKRQVKVDNFLASTAYPKLYCIGAVSDLAEPALTPNIQAQAKTIAKNIVKPGSAVHIPGPMKKPMIQIVGSKTFGMLIPSSMNAPSCCSTLMFKWCGFPCNLLCPCVCCMMCCGPMDFFFCGYCCGDPEGQGVPNTLNGLASLGVAAGMAGMDGIAKVAPEGSEMKR